jgi:hypothetical protein
MRVLARWVIVVGFQALAVAIRAAIAVALGAVIAVAKGALHQRPLRSCTAAAVTW